jgi:hypothetical protein
MFTSFTFISLLRLKIKQFGVVIHICMETSKLASFSYYLLCFFFYKIRTGGGTGSGVGGTSEREEMVGEGIGV